jgi:hypothetical protein
MEQHIHRTSPVNMAQVLYEMQMISLVFISIDKMEEREERTRGIMAKRWK